jgi:hypothetical protein
MTTPGSQAGTRPAQGTPADVLRAAADFIDSSGQHDGVIVTCRSGHVSISVTEPYGDAAARQAVVTRLAGLIGGTVRRENERKFPAAGLRADGAIGGLRAQVWTLLDVRRSGPRPGHGRPLAEAPGGQVTAVPGKLPDGWRWVTELDPEPVQAVPRKQSTAAPARAAAEAPALAAPSCPPLTGAGLQAAARQEQAANALPARPSGTARRPLTRPPS